MANKKSTLPYIPIPYPLGNIKGPGQGSQVPMPQPQAGDVYNSYWDLFQQFGNYNQNFWETLFDLNETDARDFAFNQLGKQQDYLALLEQRDYDKSQLQDQRNYDFALLQNQRQYESPAAQLGRLMQTGLSRQAALQMIQSGSIQPTAGSPVQSQGIPSSSDGSGVSAASAANSANQLNTLRSVASAIFSLASFGVSAGAAGATSSLQVAQQVAQQQANRAQQVSAALNAGLWRKQKDGADFKGKSFDDVAAMFADDEQLSPMFNELMSTPGAYRIGSDNFNVRFGNKNLVEQSLQEHYRSEAAKVNLDELFLNYDWQQLQFEDYKIPRDLVNSATFYDWTMKTRVLLEQSTDEKFMKDYIQSLKNDASYMAVTSAIKLRTQDELKKSLDSNSEMTDSLKMSYFLDMCGLTGEVGSFFKGSILMKSGIDWFKRNHEDTPAGKLWNRFKQHLTDLETQSEESISIPESIKSLGTDMESDIESGYDPNFWKKIFKR